jgi:Arc-like DNA binding domain
MAPISVLEPIMPNLSVKDVPESWAETLRQRAARHHRSLQGELMAIIEAAVQEPAIANRPDSSSPILTGNALGVISGYDRFGQPIIRQGWKTVEQVAADLNAIYPQPIAGQPLAVDILRAERDAR